MKAKDCYTKITSSQKSTLAPNSFFASIIDDFEKLKKHSDANKKEQSGKRIKCMLENSHPSVPEKNKFAAIEESGVETVRKLATLVTGSIEVNPNQQILWKFIMDGIKLANTIQSCDLPSDDPLNSALVKTVQNRADEILADRTKSWLHKILKIAILTKEISYGNCQEKAFFVFAYMLYQLVKQNGLIHTLRLATFKNHFILIVNEEFLMDPWLSLAFPLDPQKPMFTINFVFEGFGELINYFSANIKGTCVAYSVREGQEKSIDLQSEEEFQECISWLNLQSQHFVSEEEIESSSCPIVLKKQKLDPKQNMVQYSLTPDSFWKFPLNFAPSKFPNKEDLNEDINVASSITN